MGHNPTIADVAERAGVSKGTVSAVLNDKSSVSDATRKRVRDVIKAMNYRPRASAQHLLQGDGDRTIGLVIKEDDNPYYAGVIAGVRRVAGPRGYVLLVASSEGSSEAEHRVVEAMAAKDVSGLIITPALGEEADVTHLFELKRRNIPFVLLERIRGIQSHIVDIDNVLAARDAVGHLIERGHSHIVHFAGPPYSAHSQERVEGVRRGFSESSLVFRDEFIVPTGAHMEDGYETGLAYFRACGADRPTAVTCYNDLVAIGLLRALRELGLRVPDDVSVVGCDDLPLMDYLGTPLTSVRIPKEEMGAAAAEILIRHLEAEEPPPLEKVTLDAEVVVRASTTDLASADRAA